MARRESEELEFCFVGMNDMMSDLVAQLNESDVHRQVAFAISLREPTLQRTDVDAVNGCTGSHVLQRRFDAVRPHVVDERCRRLADAQQRGAGDAGLVRDGAHAGTRSVATV